MQRNPRAALMGALALLTLGIAACGSATSAPSTHVPVSRSASVAPGTQGGQGAKATAIGRTDPAQTIEITLSLPGKAPAELQRFLAGLRDPHSPSYHQYLTPDEFAARFGVDAQVTARVERVLSAAGLTPADHLQGGQLLVARGTVGQVEGLFGITLEDYRAADHTTYHAPVGSVRIPAALRDMVTGVLGLDTSAAVKPAGPLRRQSSEFGPAPYTPADLERLYDIGPLHASGLDGTGQTVAFAEIDTFDQKDIDVYDQKYGLQTQPVEVVGNVNKVEGETTLDIEVVHAIAPKAHLIVYEADSSFMTMAQNVAEIVTQNRAHVLSISLGACETRTHFGHAEVFPVLDTAFQQAAAQGMTVLISSGDNGAYGCIPFNPNDFELSTSWPSDNPYVTSVGGTALFTKADGSYDFEAGWESPLASLGGGGGVSTVYKRPDWQTGPGTTNQYSNGMRQEPDVSADADPLTGYSVYLAAAGGCQGDDCWTTIGGTSAATPLWAALVTLGNQQAQKDGKQPLGFLNPALYQVATQNLNPAPFRDILQGGNLYYQAGPGWDAATGLGTPDAAVLIPALLALPRATGTGSGTPTATPTATPKASPTPSKTPKGTPTPTPKK